MSSLVYLRRGSLVTDRGLPFTCAERKDPAAPFMPSDEIVTRFIECTIDRQQFLDYYLYELAEVPLEQWKKLFAYGARQPERTVTLLCRCAKDEGCHSEILIDYVTSDAQLKTAFARR